MRLAYLSPDVLERLPVAGHARALAALARAAVSYDQADDRGNVSAVGGAGGEGV